MKAFALLALVALASADVSHLRTPPQHGPDHDAVITSQNNDVGINEYSGSFSTSNGIQAQEAGQLKNAGSDAETLEVQGQASWTSNDGQNIELSYIANENGYQPRGAHLPTSPPIPEAILRSLEYIAAHPPPPETQQPARRF